MKVFRAEGGRRGSRVRHETDGGLYHRLARTIHEQSGLDSTTLTRAFTDLPAMSEESQEKVAVRALLIFTGSGPILVLSTYPSAEDPRLIRLRIRLMDAKAPTPQLQLRTQPARPRQAGQARSEARCSRRPQGRTPRG